MSRTYFGVNIHPADFNASGIRWVAHVPGVGALRADTMLGIRRLIRATVTKQSLP